MKKKTRAKINLKLIIYIVLRLVIVLTAIIAFFDGSYYVVLLCGLAFILFFLPAIIDKKFNIEVPNALEIIVILFIFSSVFLGEIRGYYESFPYWDKILHTSSGFLSAAIGFSLIDILNRSEKVHMKLSPFFAAIFVFCFSMTVGVIWEFYEFGCDTFLGLDMQKDHYVQSFRSTLLDNAYIEIESVVINGEVWEGYVDIGIIDTMEDLIVNAIGAFVFSLFGWFYIKGQGKWIENFMPKLKEIDSQGGSPQENEKNMNS